VAERRGDRRAIVLGGLTYAVGLTLSAFAVSPEAHAMLQLMIGFGIAGTGFGVILAVVGRATPPEHRSLALGIATAAGSAGQVVGPPAAGLLLAIFAWPAVFLIFAGAVLASLLVLPLMRVPPPPPPGEGQSTREALRTAFRDPSFALIFLGFFSCGYQLAFITAHFPAS
jgi:MFS family permease